MRADKSSIKPNYRQKVQVVLALGTIKVRRLRAGLGMALLNFDKAKLAQAENRPVTVCTLQPACLASSFFEQRTPSDNVVSAEM